MRRAANLCIGGLCAEPGCMAAEHGHAGEDEVHAAMSSVMQRSSMPSSVVSSVLSYSHFNTLNGSVGNDDASGDVRM